MSCSRTTTSTVHDEPPVGTRERRTPATYAASVIQDTKTFQNHHAPFSFGNPRPAQSLLYISDTNNYNNNINETIKATIQVPAVLP